jgi:predicted secreted protein
MGKRSPVFAMLFLTAASLWAGDVASFVDLGFSENGGIYVFAQYGVDENTLRPWSDLFIVNVDRNDFVPGGRVSYKHDKPVAIGQDGSAALLRNVANSTQIIEKYRTNFMRQGIPLFISLEEGHNPKGETIAFRDFERGSYYIAKLNSIVYGSDKNTSSSFFITLERRDAKGGNKTWTVGSPDVRRKNVSSYTIKKVVVNPERSSLILVIEMTVLNGNGPDIRYMIEAIRF